MLNKELLRPLRNFGIFLGIVCTMAAVLITLIVLARGSWNRGLALTLQELLDREQPATYTVGEALPLQSMYATSAAAYVITSADTPRQYGVIVRIPTIAGAVPAVFICSATGNVSFVGYAVSYGHAATIFEKDSGIKNLQYWQQQVTAILRTAQGEFSL